MNTPLLHRTEKLAAPFPPLLIEAERIAQAVQQGIHGRRREGIGETFWQYRRYEQGDPIERIDWRQSARTDKIFIREREWEAAQTAILWSDTSGSMRYASSPSLSTKSEDAQLLMLALSSLLLRGGEKIAWLANRRKIDAHGRNGLEHIISRLGQSHDDQSLPPSVPLPRNAHIILCSDFLMPDDKLQNLMHRYAALNLRGILVHIQDPAEIDFPFDGRVEMQGCENEPSLILPNATSLREAFNQRMASHTARLHQLTQSAHWHYINHITSTPLLTTLLQLHTLLAMNHKRT